MTEEQSRLVQGRVMLTTVERFRDAVQAITAKVKPLDKGIAWMRKSSLWPLGFGLACCAIEMMATFVSRWDIDRFGAGVMRPSPRQADLMLVAGTVTLKMAPVVKKLWDQMPDPKYSIAMGSCAMSGGGFDTYAVLQGVDEVIPVDVYIAGCPPQPENLLEGLFKMQKIIMEREGQLLEDIWAR